MNKQILFIIILLVFVSCFSDYTTQEASSAYYDIKDGDLIINSNAQGNVKFDIYIVKLINNKKFRRLILSPKVFLSYGHLDPNSVIDVDQATMDSYVISDFVRAEGDPKVYRLIPNGDTGERIWIETADAFVGSGYDWDAIYMINEVDRDEYIDHGQTITLGSSQILDEAWGIFQQYLVGIKDHDVDLFNSISYYSIENDYFLCSEDLSEDECKTFNSFLDIFYETFAEISKESFVNVEFDSKQVVLFSNPAVPENGIGAYGAYYMFFVRNSEGILKILGANISISVIIENFKDSDNDGLSDRDELCEGVRQSDLNCKKTDPAKRDTDGDGWWDSIEDKFKE